MVLSLAARHGTVKTTLANASLHSFLNVGTDLTLAVTYYVLFTKYVIVKKILLQVAPFFFSFHIPSNGLAGLSILT